MRLARRRTGWLLNDLHLPAQFLRATETTLNPHLPGPFEGHWGEERLGAWGSLVSALSGEARPGGAGVLLVAAGSVVERVSRGPELQMRQSVPEA